MKHLQLFEDFGVVKNMKDLDPKLASTILSNHAAGNWDFKYATGYENSFKKGEYIFSFYGGRVAKDLGDVIMVTVYNETATSEEVHIEDEEKLSKKLVSLYLEANTGGHKAPIV